MNALYNSLCLRACHGILPCAKPMNRIYIFLNLVYAASMEWLRNRLQIHFGHVMFCKCVWKLTQFYRMLPYVHDSCFIDLVLWCFYNFKDEYLSLLFYVWRCIWNQHNHILHGGSFSISEHSLEKAMGMHCEFQSANLHTRLFT